jgi:hypothetical protein
MPTACALAAEQRVVLGQIAELEAADAQLFARRMRLRAEAEVLWEDQPAAFDVLELSGTARIGQVRAATQLLDGRRLVACFPVALGLLETGVMFRETAVLLLAATRACTDAVQAQVDARVSAQVAALNTTDARKVIERTVLQAEADLDPELTRERLEKAKRERSVWTRPAQDGMLEVGASLTAVQGRRWVLDFEELVRAQQITDQQAGVQRTQAQRRADVFAELPSRLIALVQLIQQGRTAELLELATADPDLAEQVEALAEQTLDLFPTRTRTPTPGAGPARVAVPSVEEVLGAVLSQRVRNPVTISIHIPMTTVLDLDHRAGWLEGYGPVPAEHCRLLVPTAGLRQVYVDAGSGVPLGIDATTHPPLTDELPLDPEGQGQVAGQVRRRLLGLLGPRTVAHDPEPRHDPSPALRAFVEARDLTCTGIGCAMTARRSDKDHETRWPQGPTAAWNLSSKSPRCHHAKHTGWDLHRADTGELTWTSPLGHSYRKPGVWQAPDQLPHDLNLPTPRLTPLNDHDPHPLDLALDSTTLPPKPQREFHNCDDWKAPPGADPHAAF